jgi:pyruvate-formate lyase
MTTAIAEKIDAVALSPAVAQAVEFTQTFQRYIDAPPAIREAMCLKTQYPAILGEIIDGDLIAGRRAADKPITYIGSIFWAGFAGGRPGARPEGKQGGYCFDFTALDRYAHNEADHHALIELAEFWETHYTWSKVHQGWDEHLRTYINGQGQITGGGAGFGLVLNLDRLVQQGIPGLREDIQSQRTKEPRDQTQAAFYDAANIALHVLVEVCHHYQNQAEGLAAQAGNNKDRQRLLAIAKNLSAITLHTPQTFAEAIQLIWIYSLLAGWKHVEAFRLDVALGDLYAHDIDAGVISEAEALEWILCLWRLFNETGEAAVCRIVLGGMGRRNEANADRFAMAAMEATRRHRKVTPQLTLRLYNGQNPKLLEKALQVVGEGVTYPMLYNDDVVVPGIAKALGVSAEIAHLYHPMGCGEYMLAHCSPSILVYVWSVPKTVEAVLRNGKNSDGKPIGPATGTLDSLDTFEAFYSAFVKQVHFSAELAARAYRCNLDALPKECAYLYGSLLSDDCIERGRALLDGGVRYNGACIMGHGFTNAADSLTAIRKLVYQEKRLTLAELMAALDADFKGYEATRKLLLAVPKFGNDDDEADQMLTQMWRDMNAATKDAGARVGLAFLTVSSVNPGGYWLGQNCGATADGRLKGQPFAIGHAPTAGQDRSGLTALFNSVAKVDADSGGATTNFKLSPEWFKGAKSQAETMFKVYFGKGGQEATVTVVNRDDLKAALKEPEKYPHVLVRLGGWSARFIDLEKNVQMEILERTQY